MYKKKFLSLIGLVFVGKTFADVALPACNDFKTGFTPSDCTEDDSEEQTITYCTASNKIYEVTNVSNFNCRRTSSQPEGLFLFKVEANACVALIEEPSDWTTACTSYYSGATCGTSVTSTDGCASDPTFNSENHKKKITKVSKVDLTAAGADISSDSDSVALYNCDGTQCQQTAGYVMDSAKQYIVAATGGATDISSEAGYDLTDCVTGGDKTGVLNTNNNKLCISSTVAVAAGPGKENIMSNVESNIFTGATANNNFIVIKEDTNIFAWDNLANAVKFVKKSDSTVVTSIDDAHDAIAENPENYEIYDCKNGICQIAYGYIKSGTDVFAYVNGEDGTAATSAVFAGATAISSASACSTSNIGQVLTNAGGICINQNKVVTFDEPDPLAYDEHIILSTSPAVEGTPFYDSDYGVPIKRGDNYILKDVYFDEVVLVKKEDSKIEDYSGPNEGLSGSAGDPTKYIVVDCVNGKCKQTEGYILNNAAVFAFGKNGGKKTANDIKFVGETAIAADTNCVNAGIDGATVGMIYNTNGGICIGTGTGIAFNADSSWHLLLKEAAVEGTPFYDNTNSVPIKNGAGYIVRDYFYEDGVNLVKTSDGTVLTNLGSDITINNYYVLVDCVDSVCKQTQGYILDGAGTPKVIAFVGDSISDIGVAGTDVKFVGGAPITESAGCTSDYIGMLYNDDDGVCVYHDGSATKIGVPFTVNAADPVTRYILDSGVADTPFESNGGKIAIKKGPHYIIRDEFNTSVKLIKTADMSLSDIGINLATANAYQNYKIVECIKGICEYTEGYVKYNDNVYKFNFDSAGSVTTSFGAVGVTKESECTEDHVGTIFTYNTNKKAICIGHGKSVNFEDSGNYMVVKDIVAGTPFKNADYSISIKSGENYIIKEKFNSSVNLVKSSNSFSIADLKTANGALALNPSDYVIFDCVNGDCVQTVGYVINSSKVFSFVGINGGVEVTSSGVSSCSAGAIGKLLSTRNKICISSSSNIELTDTNVHMIIQGKAASGTPFESSEKTVQIKSSANYVVKDNFVDNGVYLVNVNDGTIKTENDIGNPIADLANNYLIVECNKNVCIQTPGYIKNNSEVYSFTGNNAGIKVTSTVLVTSCDKVGNVLSTKNGICYGSGSNKIDFDADTGYIILKGLAVSNTPFEDSKNSVPIKSGTNYIIKDNFYTDGVNLVKKSDGTILTNLGSAITINNNYVLVDCVDSVCKQTQGYVLDGATEAKVIAFVGDEVGEAGNDPKFVGQAETPKVPISASTGCTSDYIGMLYNGKDGVCVYYYDGDTDIKIGVAFTTTATDPVTRYILDSGVADTPFESNGGKIAIKKGPHYIIRDEFYNSDDYCTYAVSTTMEAKKTKFCSDEPKISSTYYKCTDGQCSVVADEDKTNNVGNGIYMFKVAEADYNQKVFKCKNGECELYEENGIYAFQSQDDEDTIYMTRVDDIALNALTGISKNPFKLYHCFDGVCIGTGGFFRYGNGPSVASCVAESSCTISEFVKCNTAGDDENVRSNMDLCIDRSQNKFEPFVGVGIFYGSGPTYTLYKRTGVNVVGISQRSGNYYSALDEKLYVCTGNSCTIGIAGYTLNSDTDTKDEYPLIYCSGAGINCSIKSKAELANGYYLNSGSTALKYIICDNDECKEETTTIEKSNCSVDDGAHKYGMIHETDFKFCKGDGSGDGVAVPTDNSFKYYLIEDSFEPGKHFNYPNGIEGEVERTVLIKTEKYSITALTGNDIPIGYLVNGDGTGYIECKFTSEGESRECKIANIDDADADTTKECLTVGGLYKKGSKNRVCLDTADKINIDLTTDGAETNTDDDGIDSEGMYVLPLGEGLFGISKGEGNEYYIVVNVDDKGNVTVVKELESIKYRYTATDAETHKKTLYKLYDKVVAESAIGNDDICDAREGKAKPFEFQLIEWTVGSGANSNVDYYVKGVNDDLNNS